MRLEQKILNEIKSQLPESLLKMHWVKIGASLDGTIMTLYVISGFDDGPTKETKADLNDPNSVNVLKEWLDSTLSDEYC